MSRLESFVRPIITPLVRGEACLVDAYMLGAVAAWTLKTAMMLEQATPNSSSIPREHYESLYEARIPPLSVQVGIAAIRNSRAVTRAGFITPGPDISVRDQPDFVIPEGAQFYGFTLQVGSLVLQGSGHTVPDALFVADHGRFPDHLLRAWPARGELQWPPAATLDDESMEEFSRAFGTGGDPDTLEHVQQRLADSGFEGYSGEA